MATAHAATSTLGGARGGNDALGGQDSADALESASSSSYSNNTTLTAPRPPGAFLIPNVSLMFSLWDDDDT
jgi:hypothetical protein